MENDFDLMCVDAAVIHILGGVSDSSVLDGANLCHRGRCSFEERMGSK